MNVQNQMQEALMLFESICNSQWFIQTSIILFLNKIDLFKEKLPQSPVKKYFPDYQGDPKSYKMASEFFQENFKRLNRNSSKVCTFSPELYEPLADKYTGYLRALYQCHRYQPSQEDYGQRPGYGAAAQPESSRTVSGDIIPPPTHILAFFFR